MQVEQGWSGDGNFGSINFCDKLVDPIQSNALPYAFFMTYSVGALVQELHLLLPDCQKQE